MKQQPENKEWPFPGTSFLKCKDCGQPIIRGKLCKACRDFVKAFTRNKYGELA